MYSKCKRLSAVMLFALLTSSVIRAEDSRYIIKVNETHKGNVKALAMKMANRLNFRVTFSY